MYFRTAVSFAWSNSEVGRAVPIYSLTESEHQQSLQSLNIRQDGIVSLNPCNGYCYRFQEFQAAYHSFSQNGRVGSLVVRVLNF